MRLAVAALSTLCLLTGGARQADPVDMSGSVAQAKIRTIRGFEQFQTWARLVQAHVPGSLDDAARTIAAWPPGDLHSTLVDLNALGELLATPRPRTIRYPEPPRADGQRRRQREISINLVPAMLMLDDDPFGAGLAIAMQGLERDVTHFMKLAAMLHADIAILAAPRTGDARWASEWADPGSLVLMLRDGRPVGMDAAGVHWELGRAALDMVKVDRAVDEFVRMWYDATSSYQMSHSKYGYAAPNLEHARKVLPADPHIQFCSGVLQENTAAPPVQVAVQSVDVAGLPYNYNAESVPEKLKQAESYLRRALDLDADLHEARVHLGRVVGLRGRHDEAAAQLRRAVPALTNDTARYYAVLFLGGEEQALGHSEDARASFERARALFPLAQSPLLALSQLAWHDADRAGALSAFREVATLPAVETTRQDPWWTYDVSAFGDAAARLAGLRAAAQKEKAR
jgi:tetratricopeptide (TPR) repeat protein